MTPAPEDLLQRTLGGYLLESFIGPRAFAWVYGAVGPRRRRSAVKVLTPRSVGQRDFETRFLNEARTADSLRHPNIVRIRKIGTESGLPYFAMDYYPSSLAERLEQSGPLEEPDLLRVATQIAHALALSHAHGIVHCDIKPHNILFAANGDAVLTDFGIARSVQDYVSGVDAEMTIGTPHYLSPEQAQGLPLDGRSDLYSLGITLYKAALGTVPFQSTDWYELARMHVENPPEPPRTRRPDLTPSVERIILKLLAKKPDDRFPSATALLKALQPLQTLEFRMSNVELRISKDLS